MLVPSGDHATDAPRPGRATTALGAKWTFVGGGGGAGAGALPPPSSVGAFFLPPRWMTSCDIPAVSTPVHPTTITAHSTVRSHTTAPPTRRDGSNHHSMPVDEPPTRSGTCAHAQQCAWLG